MTQPSPEQFAALARSSPWRWRTLRFTVSWSGDYPTWPRPVRAWIRRPDTIRVEELCGTVIRRETSSHPWGRSARLLPTGQLVPVPGPEPYGPLDPRASRPQVDADGLVVRRPVETGLLCYDDPMFQNYRWVAMLDPVELADGLGRGRGDPQPEPVQVLGPHVVTHHGRPAWEATLRPTEFYDPRCPCCELLFSAASEQVRVMDGEPTVRDRQPDVAYPDAHRVRLDVATGVCVLTEELGGSRPGAGHDMRIETVDEAVP